MVTTAVGVDEGAVVGEGVEVEACVAVAAGVDVIVGVGVVVGEGLGVDVAVAVGSGVDVGVDEGEAIELQVGASISRARQGKTKISLILFTVDLLSVSESRWDALFCYVFWGICPSIRFAFCDIVFFFLRAAQLCDSGRRWPLSNLCREFYRV